MVRKTITFGAVQKEFINKLRAELLGQGQQDLSFTEGVNFAVVALLGFLFADEYLDRHGLHGEVPRDVAAAEIAADYLITGDVPGFIKDSYGAYAESFATTTIQTMLTDDVGVPDAEWWEEAGVSQDEFYKLFTAEPPD